MRTVTVAKYYVSGDKLKTKCHTSTKFCPEDDALLHRKITYRYTVHTCTICKTPKKHYHRQRRPPAINVRYRQSPINDSKASFTSPQQN